MTQKIEYPTRGGSYVRDPETDKLAPAGQPAEPVPNKNPAKTAKQKES